MAYRPAGGGGIGFGPSLSPAVKMIMLWNVIIFLLQQLFGFGLTRIAGLVPYAVVLKGFIWQPVTYLFLHGGLFHLLFNMFALWMFGSELEYLWGTRRWLKYYFITGIGAAVTTMAFAWAAYLFDFGNPQAILIPTVGASGAIYGLLLAFGLTFPNRPIFLWFLFPIPARIFVLIFGAIEFISSISYVNDGIGHFAHLGGMVFGYILLRGWPGSGGFRGWRRKRKLSVYDFDDGPPRRR
ncbi:MAG: rhomboid family intramembrane serine protease [Candidatus Eisenbacteria bacterium]|nr:rhomboid family intramembrane serine protease [Candidatus Eisenbacteria bacterium]